jgi:hypothetical protein
LITSVIFIFLDSQWRPGLQAHEIFGEETMTDCWADLPMFDLAIKGQQMVNE